MSMLSLAGTNQSLAPHELRMATDAFESALRMLDESTCPHDPHRARQTIARYIIERALGGERNEAKLVEGALRCMRLAGTGR